MSTADRDLPTDSSFKISADPSNILMSDVLKGNVPALDDSFTEQVEDTMVTVVLERSGAPLPIVGSLAGLSIGDDIELDVRVPTTEAFEFITTVTSASVIETLQLHLGEKVVEHRGPYGIVKPGMFDLDLKRGMCVLSLRLAKR